MIKVVHLITSNHVNSRFWVQFRVSLHFRLHFARSNWILSALATSVVADVMQAQKVFSRLCLKMPHCDNDSNWLGYLHEAFLKNIFQCHLTSSRFLLHLHHHHHQVVIDNNVNWIMSLLTTSNRILQHVENVFIN